MNYRTTFFVLLILTGIVVAGMQLTGKSLINDLAPAGIVSFELAGSLDSATQIIDSWGVEGQKYAAFNLGLDYLFLLLYSILLAFASILIVRSTPEHRSTIRRIGYIVAFGSILAGVFDAIENSALTMILMGFGTDLLAAIANYFAHLKFFLVFIAILYIIPGGVYVLLIRRKRLY